MRAYCSFMPNILVFTTLDDSGFLVFGAWNAKYLAFDTLDDNALITYTYLAFDTLDDNALITYTLGTYTF